VAHQVGKDGRVVRNFSTDWNGDGFTASMGYVAGEGGTTSKSKNAQEDNKLAAGHIVANVTTFQIILNNNKLRFYVFETVEVKSIFCLGSLTFFLAFCLWPAV
jgi:hypothetical protein